MKYTPKNFYKILSLITVALFLTINILACSKKQEDIIKVGVLTPLTGQGASYGENFKNGIAVAMDEKTAENVQFIFEDTKGQPKEAVNAANKLLMDKNVKIIVTVLSSVTNAVAPILINKQPPVILMATLTSQSGLTEQSPYIFRYFLSAEDEVSAINSYLSKNSVNKIGVIYLNDEFGKDAYGLFMKKFNGEIVFEDTFRITDTDFKSLSAKVKNLKHLYIIGYGNTYGLLFKQLREFGFTGNIYAFSGVGSPTVRNAAGNAARGIIFSSTTFNPNQADNKEQETFIQGYNKKFGKLPDHYAAYGYDIGKMLIKTSTDKKMTSEQLKNKLYDIKSYTGVFGKTTMTDTGDFYFDVKLFKVNTDDSISTLK